MQEIEKQLRERLAQLAQALYRGQTEAFLAWLDKLGKFRRYSLLNQLSILAHCRHATLVAGLRRWNQLGRRVKRGEKGIPILAPVLKTVEEDGLQVRKLVCFRRAHVFDVSQTEGEPVNLEPPAVSGEEGLLARLIEACPLPVKRQPMLVGRLGETNGRAIHLAEGISDTQAAGVLLHEWAHALLHFPRLEGVRPETLELEAEAVAYVAGREIGLGMEFSSDYILHWRGGAEELQASMDRIVKGARDILTSIQHKDGPPSPCEEED